MSVAFLVVIADVFEGCAGALTDVTLAGVVDVFAGKTGVVAGVTLVVGKLEGSGGAATVLGLAGKVLTVAGDAVNGLAGTIPPTLAAIVLDCLMLAL